MRTQQKHPRACNGRRLYHRIDSWDHCFKFKVTSINYSSGLPLSERWGVSCPGWFILPPAQEMGQTVSSANSYCIIILEYLVVICINIVSVNLRCLHQTISSVILVRGVGWGGKLSRLVYLPPPPLPARDLGQTVSSVNSYCTTILEYLVVRDVNIISDSQTEMFTSNVQFGYPCPRGGRKAVQAGLSCPPPRNGQTSSSVNSYCTIILEYSVVRDVNIISVKLRCLHLTFSLVTLVRGVGGKMSRRKAVLVRGVGRKLVYLALRRGIGANSIIS